MRTGISRVSYELCKTDDKRAPLRYMSRELSNVLELEPVADMPVQGSMLMTAAKKSRRNPAWYNPQMREFVFSDIGDAVAEKFSNGERIEASKEQIWKLVRYFEGSTIRHELAHYEKTLSENHYYRTAHCDLQSAALDFLSTGSIASVREGVICAFSTVANSIFPQEFLGVSAQEEYLSGLLNRRIADFRDCAEQRFLAYEDSGDAEIKRERCRECEYLLPFIAFKEFQNWDIPIRSLDFKIVLRNELNIVNEAKEVFIMKPDWVWLAAATTSKKEINQAGNQVELLLQKVLGMSPQQVKQTYLGYSSTQSAIDSVVMNQQSYAKRYFGLLTRLVKEYDLIRPYADPRIRQTLDGCYIIWELGVQRKLYMAKNALEQGTVLERAAIGLCKLTDSIVSPVIYSLRWFRGCRNSKHCPIFKAIRDKCEVPDEAKNFYLDVPNSVWKYVDSLREQLEPEYKWLVRLCRDPARNSSNYRNCL